MRVAWTERIKNGHWHSVRRGRVFFALYKNNKPTSFHIYIHTDYVGKKRGRVLRDTVSPFVKGHPPTSQRINGRRDWHPATPGLSIAVQPIKLLKRATDLATCTVKVSSKGAKIA